MLRALSHALEVPVWHMFGSPSLGSPLRLRFHPTAPRNSVLLFKVRAGFMAVNAMDNGGLQWLSPKTSMTILIYTAPMNLLSNGPVSIMQRNICGRSPT